MERMNDQDQTIMGGMLTIQGLPAVYGRSAALKDGNIDLLPEQAICLTERKGVGKTTLLKTIMGHIHPKKGKIEL